MRLGETHRRRERIMRPCHGKVKLNIAVGTIERDQWFNILFFKAILRFFVDLLKVFVAPLTLRFSNVGDATLL